MSTIEIKQELQNIINNNDDKFVKEIYKMVVNYQLTLKEEKMILEGEEDIKNGSTYSLEEAKKMIR